MENEVKSENSRFLAGAALIVLVAGLLIRLVLAPLLTYPFDIEHWAVIIQNIDSGNGLYGLSGYFYTPVWGYIMGFDTLLMNAVGGLDTMADRFTDLIGIEGLDFRFFTATTTTPVFNTVMKIPLIIVDVAVGYLLWDLVMEKTASKRKADTAFALWFLCPVVVYMSGIQAQFDCMSAMFTLLTVLLVRKDHCFLAGMMFTVAALIKFFPAFIIFVLVLYLWRKHASDGTAVKRILISVAGAVVAFCVIYAPQMIDGTFVDSLSFILGRASESEIFEKVYTYGMVLVTLLALFYTARHILKFEKGDLDDEFLMMTTVTLAAACMISGGPQYCIVYLPLLAYYASVSEGKLYMRCFIVIGVLSMIVAFINNSFSLLTSVTEYWGWIDPQVVVDAMRSVQGFMYWLRVVVQVFQGVALFMTFAFLFTDTVHRDHPVIRVVNEIKARIGGEHVEDCRS